MARCAFVLFRFIRSSLRSIRAGKAQADELSEASGTIVKVNIL